MMRAILLGIFFLVIPVLGQSKNSIPGGVEAPGKGVFDPDSWLEPARKLELEAIHASALEKWGVKVFVIIIAEKPAEGVESFSQKMGESWGGSGTWGVLTHVIDDPESPWCYGGRGEYLRWSKEEEFDLVLARARSRARRESDPVLSVTVGARELTDELGFLGIVSKRRYQMFGDTKQSGDSPKVISKHRKFGLNQFFMIAFPLLLVVSIVGLICIRRLSKRPPKGFKFPETARRRRFSGPWSGGGNVLVKFASEASDDRPEKR